MKELKKITQEELNEVIEKHKNWLNDEKGGEQADLSYTDLRELDFRNCDLLRCNFINADLSHSNFTNSDLSRADFTNAVFKYCNFTNVDLSFANFTHANFKNCNFKNADLSYAKFTNANLLHANFKNAFLRYTNLSHADLARTLIPIYCHHFVAHTHDFKEVSIGCKRKTIEEWDYFFNESDEEYATKRGTEEFKRIQANYLAMKAYIEFMKK